jgi:hypothetical protein
VTQSLVKSWILSRVVTVNERIKEYWSNSVRRNGDARAVFSFTALTHHTKQTNKQTNKKKTKKQTNKAQSAQSATQSTHAI